jgi:hypothetical protein
MIDGTHGRKRCLACRRLSTANAPEMSIEIADKVRLALRNGANLKQITTGNVPFSDRTDPSLIITTYKIIQRHRRENPDFNESVNAALGRAPPLAAVGTYRYHWNPSDLDTIPALLRDGFPGKGDVVQSIFVALIEGRIDRSQLDRYFRRFVTEYHRQHPTKYAKFGDSQLLSLDEVMFEDGSRPQPRRPEPGQSAVLPK